jgi:branched-chain amino acid transport system substrate-binding protein
MPMALQRFSRTVCALPGRRAAVSAAVAVTLLAAAGCGAGSASGTTDTAGLSGTPIVIGAMVDQSSPTSGTDRPAADVVKAWAEHTNKNGGIGGHPVELRLEDTRGDAPTATTVAETFLGDDSVVAVLMASSGVEGAVGPLFAQSDLAVSGVGYNPQVWSALPNFYSVTTTFPAVVDLQARSAAGVGATKLAVLACAENPNCSAAAPLLEKAAGATGLAYAGLVTVSASAPNYTAECLKLVGDGVDFAQLSASEETSSRVVADCQRQGYQGYFGASSGSVTPGLYADSPGVRLAGGVNGFPWWIDTPAVASFRQAMDQQGVPATTYGDPHATGMWAAAELLRTALKGVTKDSAVTRATVQDGYGAIQGEDLGGLLPMPMTYRSGQPAPPVSCYWLYSFADGKFAAGSDRPTCDQPAG